MQMADILNHQRFSFVYLQAVETNSPAMDAGLSAGDLITHVNDTSVQGLLHIELVRLILTGGNRITIRTVPLSSTSIRIGNRKSLCRMDKLTRMGGKSHKPAEDKRRRSSLFRRLSNRKVEQLGSPMSPHRRSLSSVDSQPNSPTQKVSCRPLNIISNWSQASDSAHSTENSSSSSPGSSTPGSPANTMTPFSRPSSLHGLKHKLAINRSSCNRRKSWHNNPLSPLVKTPSPSPLATSPSRSPSPLMVVHGHPAPGLHQPGISNMTQLYNPAQPQAIISSHPQARKASHARPGESSSPLLRRALSPERRFSAGCSRQMERNALSWDEQRHLSERDGTSVVERSTSSGSEGLEDRRHSGGHTASAQRVVGRQLDCCKASEIKKPSLETAADNAAKVKHSESLTKSTAHWVSSIGPLMINRGGTGEDEQKTPSSSSSAPRAACPTDCNEGKKESYMRPLTVLTSSVDHRDPAFGERVSRPIVTSGLVIVGGGAVDPRKDSSASYGEGNPGGADGRKVAMAPVAQAGSAGFSDVGASGVNKHPAGKLPGSVRSVPTFDSVAKSTWHIGSDQERKVVVPAPTPVEITVRKHDANKPNAPKEKHEKQTDHRPV